MGTLVVHFGGIGDLLLACPALRRLAEEGPLELLGRPERLALAVAAGIAHAVHDADRSGFESVFHEPNARLRALVAGVDRCILWMAGAGDIVRAIRSCGVPDVRGFPGVPPEDWPRHASHYYLECLGYAPGPVLQLPIDPAAEPYDVIIHPGSGGRRKNWPMERFEALTAALTAQGRSVTWCLGPAETSIQLPANASRLETPSLVDLARALAAARLYIGNDSGITHLAAAVGCPTLAVFGLTAARTWAPLGDHVTVVQGRPWPAVTDVLDALHLK